MTARMAPSEIAVMSLGPERSKRPGARALELLHGTTNSLIVGELQRGPRDLDDLALALPAVSRKVLSEHLSRLTREGWINDDAEPGQVAGAHAAHREPMSQLPAGAGARAFGLLADEMTRRTLLRLGRAPCDARQLQHDLDAGEPALRRTLTRLLHYRLIAQPHVRASSPKLDAPFELSPSGRGLAVIAFMLARVEWAAVQADGRPPEHSLLEYL
jgi:DNA-binding HxlR family transcriptional regulator